MTSFSAVILAAGQGKRTGLPYPKVLHPLCGKPMLFWVAEALGDLHPVKIVSVIPPGVKNEIAKLPAVRLEWAVQEKPLGTGHALRQGISRLGRKTGTLLAACGDTPLLTAEDFRYLLEFHRARQGAAAVLTALLPDPAGYGRIVRDAGEIKAIIEEKDAAPAIKEIREINTGTYVFELEEILQALPALTRRNVQHEYYLTDVVGWLVENGRKVYSAPTAEPSRSLGVNTLKEMAYAARHLNGRLLEKWLSLGVVFPDPETVYLDADISIGPGTIVYPGTFIEGGTSIGARCVIGPFARLRDAIVEDEVHIQSSVVEESQIGSRCTIGPFAYLRPGTRLASGVKVGDFVEIKNSSIGRSSKVPHLSYVGDAVLGQDVNVGAGTITCNFDGKNKHRTVIENGAFIGSNTNLVAPVRIGRGAVTGAGSVVTKNVKAESVVAGVPAKELIKKRRKRHGG